MTTTNPILPDPIALSRKAAAGLPRYLDLRAFLQGQSDVLHDDVGDADNSQVTTSLVGTSWETWTTAMRRGHRQSVSRPVLAYSRDEALIIHHAMLDVVRHGGPLSVDCVTNRPWQEWATLISAMKEG